MKKGSDWADKHMVHYKQHGFCWGHVTVSDQHVSSDWWGTLLPREIDVLTFSLAKWPRELMHDVTSSITRSTHSSSEDGKHVGIDCQIGMLVWLNGTGLSIGQDRLLLGREALITHGFPFTKVESLVEEHPEITEHSLMSVAATMMDSVVLAAVLSSTLASVTWRASEPRSGSSACAASTSDDLDDAESFLAGLAGIPLPASPAKKKKRNKK